MVQVLDLPAFVAADIPDVELYGILRGTPNSQGLVPVSAIAETAGGSSRAREWDFNFTGDSEAVIRSKVARTITQAATTGVGTASYQKSTAAAPNTFAAAGSPVTIEAGAKLKIIATGVTGTFSVHLESE